MRWIKAQSSWTTCVPDLVIWNPYMENICLYEDILQLVWKLAIEMVGWSVLVCVTWSIWLTKHSKYLFLAYLFLKWQTCLEECLAEKKRKCFERSESFLKCPSSQATVEKYATQESSTGKEEIILRNVGINTACPILRGRGDPRCSLILRVPV